MNNNALDQIIEQTFTVEPGFRLPDDFAQKFEVSFLDETIQRLIDSGKKTLTIRAENG